MSRITGTVSRSVPLTDVIGRSLTLQGTFDHYVSPDELSRINPYLDLMVSSGILTAFARYQDSDGLLAGTVGVAGNSPVSTDGFAVLGDLLVIPIDVPDAAGTQTYIFKTATKIEIIDVWNIKDTAGAGNTIQVTDANDAAITNAMVAAVDKTLTRASTIDKAKRTVEAGGTFKVVTIRAAGSMAAQLFIAVIKR